VGIRQFLEDLKGKSGSVIGFCLLLCNPVADMIAFAFDRDALSQKHEESPAVLLKKVVSMINSGHDYKFPGRK
jgi:hypothetical protein